MSSDLISYINSMKNLLTKAINDVRRDLNDHMQSGDILSMIQVNQINALINNHILSAQANITQEISARFEKERKVLENIFAIKIQEICAKMLDKVFEYKMEDLHLTIKNAIEDNIQTKLHDVIDSKISLIIHATSSQSSLTQHQYVNNSVEQPSTPTEPDEIKNEQPVINRKKACRKKTTTERKVNKTLNFEDNKAETLELLEGSSDNHEDANVQMHVTTSTVE